MQLALKIDVATLRGTREGVPALVDILQRHAASATFFFTLGPDQAGRALRRVFPAAASAVLHHPSIAPRAGMTANLMSRIVPAQDIGRRARAVLRSVADAGFETGVHAYDLVDWHAHAALADADWTAAQLDRAIERYTDVFGEPPRAFAAAGWHTNRHALRLMQRLGFDYASDGRGYAPHLPVWDAELIRCPQFPTTLPTLDEIAAADGTPADALAGELLARTAEGGYDHVFTLRAELEGLALAATFEQLVIGWKAQGYALVALRTMVQSVEPMALPRCDVGTGTVRGRSGTVFNQGEEFLGDVELPRAA